MDLALQLLVAVVGAVVGTIVASLSKVIPATFKARATLMGFLLAILGAGIVVYAWLARPDPTAAIRYPGDGTEVAITERVRGQASHVSDSDQLWVAVFAHEPSRYYPQAFAPTIEQDGNWWLTSHIGIDHDTGGRFDLVVLLVDEQAMPTLTDYVQRSATSGSWDGFERLPDGFAVLDRVTVIRGAGGPDRPAPTTRAEQVLAAAAGYLSAWVDGDLDAMCEFRMECRQGWTAGMRAFPVPVRNWELGAIEATGDGYRVDYTLELPDHGSLLGAFLFETDVRLAASVLNLTGRYVVWEDVLEFRPVDGEYRIHYQSGDHDSGSARIADFLFDLGASDAVGMPLGDADDVMNRTASYWAWFGVEFGLDADEIEPLLEGSLRELEDYFGRIRQWGEDLGVTPEGEGS